MTDPRLHTQQSPSFRRFWWSLLLPLSPWVMEGVTVVWRRQVYISGYDSPEVSVIQYGFPLAYQMDYPYSSAAWHWFLGPLLLDWATSLLVLTLLARKLWPEGPPLAPRFLPWLVWLPTVLLLTVTLIDMGLGHTSWSSPYRVLAEEGWRLHLGLSRPSP